MIEQQESKSKRRANGAGSLIKLKGCRFWYAQYYDPLGRKIRVSTKTTVRQEAQNKLTDLLADARRGLAPLVDSQKLRYKDLRQGLLDNYVAKGNKSLVQRASEEEPTIMGLKQLDEFFGFDEKNPGPRAMQLTTDVAKAFVAKRLEQGVGNAVINRSLACLRRMLKVAFQENKIQRVPYIQFLKEPRARKGFLELQKFEELIAQFPPSLKPYITFLYFCGARRTEASLIEWSQVDLARRIIRIEAEQAKTDQAREVPIPERLALMLDVIEPKAGLVFDTTNLRKEWMRACAAVGLGRIIEIEGKKYDPRYEGLTLHDFRRSAVRNLVTLAGVPEKVAMEISGHTTRSVFDRYNIVSATDKLNAMERWEATAKNLLPRTHGARLGKKPSRKARKLLTALSSRG